MFTRKEISREAFIPCHVVVRTVGNTLIFSEKQDCFRFLFQMYASNIGKPGLNLHRKNITEASKDLLAGRDLDNSLVRKEHDPLVDIISFALVRDHAHFILSANKKGAIPEFVAKLNLGFAKYFNIKNKRPGVLFNKPFKIAAIHGNSQLNTVVCYVNIKKPLEVERDLVNYPFSSFSDLFGSRKSKITVSKSRALQLGIDLEGIENYLDKLSLDDPVFLE